MTVSENRESVTTSNSLTLGRRRASSSLSYSATCSAVMAVRQVQPLKCSYSTGCVKEWSASAPCHIGRCCVQVRRPSQRQISLVCSRNTRHHKQRRRQRLSGFPGHQISDFRGEVLLRMLPTCSLIRWMDDINHICLSGQMFLHCARPTEPFSFHRGRNLQTSPSRSCPTDLLSLDVPWWAAPL